MGSIWGGALRRLLGYAQGDNDYDYGLPPFNGVGIFFILVGSFFY